MKKYVFAFSLILFIATLGWAQAAQRAEANAQKATKTVSGEVISIDLAKNEVLLKDATGKEVRLLTDSSTKVLKEGKEIALAEVKTNQKITSDYEETSGGFVARSIRVTAGKAEQ